MKKNKVNKIVTLSIIGVLVVVAVTIFILNFTKDSSSFSLLEKKWISDNINNVIDVSVYNDIPVFGENGNGVIFDYLDSFTSKYEIEFNRVSYLSDNSSELKDISFKIVGNDYNITKNDIVMYEDHYVLVGSDSKFHSSNINGSKIGVLTDDMGSISSYLDKYDNVSYSPYDNLDKLFDALKAEEVKYVIVPENISFNKVLAGDYSILYHVSDVVKKYILEINNNKTLLSIMKKYNDIYVNEEYTDDYRVNFLRSFFTYKNISEVEQASYNSGAYTYGYVVNMPFENMVSKKFVGTLSNYLSGFEDLTDTSFKIVKYKSVNDLRAALSKGEVDVAFDYYNLSGLSIDTFNTTSLFDADYVVLSKGDKVINSLKSLDGEVVKCVSGSFISEELGTNGIKYTGYADTDALLRNVTGDAYIAIDKATYLYYAHNKFEKYKILYEDTLDNSYSFVIRDVNKNDTFAKLFMYYVSSTNYKDFEYKYNTDYLYNASGSLRALFKYLIVGLVIVVVLVIVSLKRLKSKKKKSISKEDKFKFIDVMTSLKNRNYLNYNMKKWDENVIYPQTILIIDLNNIKYINDSHGHSEGDMVIKKAASILITNQLENSDIIRTDGNEFLIYMVGYKEDYVIDYIRKLTKALKDLPYGFGATMGYSMITDDVKSIDDAINEATLSMRESKEK